LEISFVALSDRTLVATFIQATEVGTSETINNFLPSYSYYNYAMSQQIYTPEEIGAAGTISCIAFYNEGAERTRTYDFYLATTEKSSFTDNVDWITMAESDKVFSGSVTMAANAWTFIVFDTPFEYDGTSNLVLVADDNSGSYNSSPYMACSVYNTSTTQALYAYHSITNFNPMSPPTAPVTGWGGTFNDILSVKNHIFLGISTSTMEQSIELIAGWNWFSTYIEAENPVALLQMLETALGEKGLYIESSELLSTEYVAGEWIGDLDEVGITNEQMYLIQTSDGCTIQLHGAIVDLNDQEITIYPEWNWVGYPCSEEMTIAEALSNMVPEDGDRIENMEGYAEYLDGEWIGLETLKPGQGFLYYSTATEPKAFTFPASAK